jgi:hypothetical protein
MSGLTKILSIGIVAGLLLVAYTGSVMGWGLSGLDSEKTRQAVASQCPEYYKNHNGDCLRSSFRSYYLMSRVRGGGFGGGK